MSRDSALVDVTAAGNLLRNHWRLRQLQPYLILVRRRCGRRRFPQRNVLPVDKVLERST